MLKLTKLGVFANAKLKLTIWYVAIIMTITLSFSALVYTSISKETQRAIDAQRVRFERRFLDYNIAVPGPRGQPMFIDEDAVSEIKSKTLMSILLINGFILVTSGVLAYLLAGVTLKPIEEMLKKQKRFVSDAAHELRTPLTAMKTDLEVTLRDKNLDLKSAKKVLAGTIEEINKLHSFTNNLLKQSKYQNTSGEEVKEEIDIKTILENVIQKLAPIAKEKEQTISQNLTNISLYAVPSAIEELFTNIIENAIKYNKKQGTVYVTSNIYSGNAVVKVKDTGIGIDPKDLPFIFEPFYRTDKSRTKNNHDGFGLGLAIAKEIVERHKGKISIASDKNGTEVSIVLPLNIVEKK